MTPTTFPLLFTKRLELIDITIEYVRDIFELFSDPKVLTYYNLTAFREEAQAAAIIEKLRVHYKNGLSIRWGIRLKGETRLIGSAGFNNYTKKHRANIGYDLKPHYWNQGLVTEAIGAIIDYGFSILSVNRIEAEVMPGNDRSMRVLEKAGFLHEGLLREWLPVDGTHQDMHMFSLLKSDWINKKIK